MARWEGNTRARLERAALDLFTEHGYDRTTVAQIAERANLTERSFYRWFPDKREVLFDEQGLEATFVGAIETASGDVGAFSTLLTAFARAPEVLRPSDFLAERAAVIKANPPLLERELVKIAALSDALSVALVRRGHDEQTARLAVDFGLVVLRLANDRRATGDQTDFAELLSTCTADVLAVASGAIGKGNAEFLDGSR